MSQDRKIEKIEKINELFSAFIKKAEGEKAAVSNNSEFLRGYQQCLVDVLEDIDSENQSELVMIIRAKIENAIKKEVYADLLDGMSAIHNGIKKALAE